MRTGIPRPRPLHSRTGGRKIRLFATGLVLASIVASLASPTRAERAELRVGLTGAYPPFNYVEPSGRLSGFDVDVAKELCAAIRRECVFEVLQWDGILSALLARRIDVVIGSMAVTPQRAAQVRFTRPYYESGAQLFTRPGAGPEDAPGFRVGVTLGTTYGEVARKRFPSAEIRTYKGDTAALQDLQAGRLDAIVTDRLVGFHMNERYGAGLVARGEPLFRESMAIPVHPDDDRLLAELNRALDELLGSARYGELFRRYFGDGTGAGVVPEGEGDFSWAGSLRLLLRALGRTLHVSALGILLGIALAIVLAFLLLALPRPLARPVAFYVDFVRSTPFLIQLFTLYFGLPAIGLDLGAFTAAVVAIGIHSSSYLGEIVKVAYQSIPSGQRAASRSLGLTFREEIRHVIGPQMLPHLTTPSLNTLVATIKDSAIVSVISVHELTMQAQQLISASFRPMELYLLTAVLYFAITYPLLFAGRRLERRYRAKGLLHA